MQKKLIALAIAGLSGAAFAQSNVTIYGAMDATFDNVRATGATTDVGYTPVNYESRNRGTMNSSFIGFKGVEALGNGLAVAWQIETGVGENAAGGTNTMGGQTYGWAGRDTYIGLAGGFGTVAFGNLTGPTRALGSSFDVNAGGTGIGANTALLGKFGGAGAGVFDQRFANTFAYISPTAAGFSGVIAYVPNENRSTSTPTTASANDTSAWTVGLNYANGPITAGYAYAKIKDSGTATLLGLTKFDSNRLGGKYDFGAGTVGLLWDRTTSTAVTTGFDSKVTVWYLPVTFKVGNGKIIAQYGKASNTTGSAAVANADTSAKHFEIGYEYSLSKRTTVKALYSQITNAKDGTYDFLYGVSNSNSTATTAGVAAGADPKGFSVGLRHSF